MTRVWGITVTVGNSVLDYQISSLRDSLEDDPENPQYIKTFRRRGIKFVGTVKVIHDDSGEGFYEKPDDRQSTVVEQYPQSGDTGLPRNHSQFISLNKALKGRFLAVFSLCILAVASILILYGRQPSLVVPEIRTLALLSAAHPKQEFAVQIVGWGFEPETVQVVMVGPGCKRFGPCTVPNNVLLDFGQVAKNKIERVPLTLGVGEYKLYVQNGKEGAPSNPWTIDVPPE